MRKSKNEADSIDVKEGRRGAIEDAGTELAEGEFEQVSGGYRLLSFNSSYAGQGQGRCRLGDEGSRRARAKGTGGKRG